MKTNNPVIAYGLVFIAIAWAVAAVITGLKYQQKSFLIFSFLAVLSLLCVITGVIIAARLMPVPGADLPAKSTSDKHIGVLMHLSGLSGYLIPLANILIPFFLWKKHQYKSEFLYETGLNSINFQLTCGVYYLSALMLCPLLIGFVMLPIVLAYQLVFTIRAVIVTKNKHIYQYPGNLRFIANKFTIATS